MIDKLLSPGTPSQDENCIFAIGLAGAYFSDSA
jgi:hypothetical protein